MGACPVKFAPYAQRNERKRFFFLSPQSCELTCLPYCSLLFCLNRSNTVQLQRFSLSLPFHAPAEKSRLLGCPISLRTVPFRPTPFCCGFLSLLPFPFCPQWVSSGSDEPDFYLDFKKLNGVFWMCFSSQKWKLDRLPQLPADHCPSFHTCPSTVSIHCC